MQNGECKMMNCACEFPAQEFCILHSSFFIS